MSAPDDPFDLGETARLMASAALQLEEAETQLAGLDKLQQKLVGYLHGLLDLVHKVETEKDVWKFRAEEMETERNQWERKAGELEYQLKRAWRVAAELGVRTGEARCPECGSARVTAESGTFPTGVVAPDGAEEHRYQCRLRCNECSHVEDIV